MNTKIFNLLKKNLESAFHLPRYDVIRNAIGTDTEVQDLPWTPARYRKFKDAVDAELQLPCDYVGTLKDITHDLSERYIHRFFGEIWKPRTNDYDYTGWQLVDEINQRNPRSVLDVGCGLNPFKGKIKNLIGDKGYISAKMRDFLMKKHNVKYYYPSKNKVKENEETAIKLKSRMINENSFSWMTQYRRLTSRFEKYTKTFESFILLAFSNITLNKIK